MPNSSVEAPVFGIIYNPQAFLKDWELGTISIEIIKRLHYIPGKYNDGVIFKSYLLKNLRNKKSVVSGGRVIKN